MLRISENIYFTNDDVIKYVIGALEWKLLRAPYPLIRPWIDLPESFTSHRQWQSQPKNFGGAKMSDFKRRTLFCLEKHLPKHKMTIFSKNLGGMAPLVPPGYAYAHRSFVKRNVFMSQSSRCGSHSNFIAFKTTSQSPRCAHWFALLHHF